MLHKFSFLRLLLSSSFFERIEGFIQSFSIYLKNKISDINSAYIALVSIKPWANMLMRDNNECFSGVMAI